MIAFPNCKINLGLHVINKRNDGYHDLETVFYPLPLYDVLEVIHSPDHGEETELFVSGIKVDTSHAQNLCVKAFHLLEGDFSHLPPVKIYLHKVIPAGAGLGGGSADGAFTILLLNERFRLELNEKQLISYALQLGSDCPFFIVNKPCFATARGEVLEPVDIHLSSYKIVVVNPGIHISTAWAFSQVAPSAPKTDLKSIVTQPVTQWKTTLENDFEKPVFSAFPEIEKIKNSLYDSGALYAGLSGSGSSVYGIFNHETQVETSAFPVHYFIKVFS